MGALFPQGLEFNIMQDAEASKVVCEQWPTPVTFCGAEIGSQVLTGEPFLSDTVSGNPVQEAYVMSLRQEGVNTHGSCDQTTVLAAVKGTDGYFATEMGTLTVNPDSSTTWVASEGGRHIRLLAEKPYAELAREIDRTMMHRPVK